MRLSVYKFRASIVLFYWSGGAASTSSIPSRPHTPSSKQLDECMNTWSVPHNVPHVKIRLQDMYPHPPHHMVFYRLPSHLGKPLSLQRPGLYIFFGGFRFVYIDWCRLCFVQTHCRAVSHEVQIDFVTQQFANVGNAVFYHGGSFERQAPTEDSHILATQVISIADFGKIEANTWP